jgi:uncharacterized protein (DUF927 family)
MFNSFFYGRKFDLNDREMAGFKQSLMKCFFIRDCILNYDKKSDKEKLVFESVKSKFNKRVNSNGNDIFHDVLRNIYNSYDNYMVIDIPSIQNNDFTKDKAFTCKAINKLGFCEGSCKVTWPFDLWEKSKSDKTFTEKNYFVHSDGLYYFDPGSASKVKLCSKLHVIGDLADSKDTNWSKLIEIETKLNTKKSLVIPAQELLGNPDNAISTLVKEGLKIESSNKATRLIRDFILHGDNDKMVITVTETGWKGKNHQQILDCHEYQLPDEIFGGEAKFEVYDQRQGNLFMTSGSLDDWQGNVGRLCKGNPLLVLLVSYALSGILLRPCQMEGGGLHLFGSSSTGKTSCAIVAGSVCGGGTPRGFSRQWRTTTNALETIAVKHNDNFLLLDEIGQASSDTIKEMSYMLSNEQGKVRLKADASMRQTKKWLINYLSTGEKTIREKIEEDNKTKALAGQEIRVIDLPIDEGTGESPFPNIHGMKDTAEFVEILRNNSLNDYGQPLRRFLKSILIDQNSFIEYIKISNNIIKKFKEQYCPENASNQVVRVAEKFGLIAAAGELAIQFRIFPFNESEALESTGHWFKVWIKHREGTENTEIIKAKDKLNDHFNRYRDTNYELIDNDNTENVYNKVYNNLFGYCFYDNKIKKFLMMSHAIKDTFGSGNLEQIKKAFDKAGYLDHNSSGNIKDTKSIKGRTVRGLIFIPSVWEREADPD